jgi:vacuolar-type H+-ATPase subunit F/Vma7
VSRYFAHVVCRPEIATGFALAGVPTAAATSQDDARRIIAALSSRPDAGVLLVQEELLQGTLAENGIADSRPLPMVVPFPGPAQVRVAGRGEAFIAEILRQAIGYRVRLR